MRGKRMILFVCVTCILSMSACGKNPQKQIDLQPIESNHGEDADGTAGSRSDGSDEQNRKDEDLQGQNQIFVYVCGAVVKPGVYAVSEGSRIYEAIQLAGGFTRQAATARINQAEVLEDEDYVYVPTKEEAASDTTVGNHAVQDTKVDLNRAGKEELMTIPGIGEAKAGQIIQYREEHGKFKKIEDIMNISGIKEGMFEKIRDYIKV